jgi:esterase/lipase
MNIINFFLVFAIFVIIFGFLYIAVKSLIKDKDYDKEFDEAVCDFIDETCIVRDKNCNIVKTHTHVITDEKGAKQILIDLIED